MLFKLLKMFGLDVPAKVAAAKSVIEQRAEEVAEYAKRATQAAAAIAALSAAAGVLAAMAAGVGLYALYRVVADSYGVYAGLGVVGGVLVATAVISVLIAWEKGQSLSSRRIFEPLRPFPTRASSPAPVVDATRPESVSRVLGETPLESARDEARPEPASDLLEPLTFLLAKYIKYPALGQPVLDQLVGNLRVTARGTADEAVERAAHLVRYGDRKQLLVLLAGAACVGWLLARQYPEIEGAG